MALETAMERQQISQEKLFKAFADGLSKISLESQVQEIEDSELDLGD